MLQVSKKKSECIFAFAQLEPLYMSPNSKEGKIECEKFFPEDYNAQASEEEEEEDEKEKEDSAVKSEAQGILYQLVLSVTFYSFVTGCSVTIYVSVSRKVLSACKHQACRNCLINIILLPPFKALWRSP